MTTGYVRECTCDGCEFTAGETTAVRISCEWNQYEQAADAAAAAAAAAAGVAQRRNVAASSSAFVVIIIIIIIIISSRSSSVRRVCSNCWSATGASLTFQVTTMTSGTAAVTVAGSMY